MEGNTYLKTDLGGLGGTLWMDRIKEIDLSLYVCCWRRGEKWTLTQLIFELEALEKEFALKEVLIGLEEESEE
jgi:hypothetical protein